MAIPRFVRGSAPDMIGCALALGYNPDYPDIAFDYGPYQNHGVMTGATWVQRADGLWVMDLNGAGDHVDIGGRNSLKPSGDFTIAAWVYRETQNYPVLIGWDASYLAKGYFLYYNQAASQWSCYLDGSSIGNIGEVMGTDAWHLVHFVFDQVNSEVRCYLDDGAAVTTTSITISISYTDVVTCRIGDSVAGGTLDWKGRIASPRIYHYAVSVEEVAVRYRGGRLTSPRSLVPAR